MTTLAQLRTQTSPCTNGCGRHVHYGLNPANEWEGRGLPLRGWTVVGSVLDRTAKWVEHIATPAYGSCYQKEESTDG